MAEGRGIHAPAPALWPTRALRHPANAPRTACPAYSMAGEGPRPCRPGRTPRVTLQRSSSLSESLARPVHPLPSSSGQDTRLSPRKRRFNSGWECHPSVMEDDSIVQWLKTPRCLREDVGSIPTGIATRGPTSGPNGHGSLHTRPPAGRPGGNTSGCSGFDSRHGLAHPVTPPLPRSLPRSTRRAEEGRLSLAMTLTGLGSTPASDLRPLPDHPTQMSSSSQDVPLPAGRRQCKSTHLLHAGFF